MIRQATIEDLPQIVEMSCSFDKYMTLTDKIPFDKEGMLKYINILFYLRTVKMFVLEINGKLEGGSAGILNPYLFNPSVTIVTELWWWVNPDHRKDGWANKLKKEIEKWGKENGATKMIMVSPSSEKEDSVKRLYKRMGYHYIESHFIRSI